MNNRVLNHKGHNKAEDLQTVNRDGLSIPIYLGPGIQQFLWTGNRHLVVVWFFCLSLWLSGSSTPCSLGKLAMLP